MIKSMTGYSSKSLETEAFTATVEVKSLNSKFFDASIRLPKGLSEKEHEIRNIASALLVRGKVSITVGFQHSVNNESRLKLNRELFETYYSELKELAQSVGTKEDDLFKLALQAPEVMVTGEDDNMLAEQWHDLIQLIGEAIDGCNEFRIKEGSNLYPQLKESIDIITTKKNSIAELDPQRITKVKEKIKAQLNEMVDGTGLDENRFEQELIYYLEKMDISEEMVRLDSHLRYFLEVMDQEVSNGKKLGFISQEIGREINTIGSKANNAGIQKLVVDMKDELEKIKEQTLNVV